MRKFKLLSNDDKKFFKKVVTLNSIQSLVDTDKQDESIAKFAKQGLKRFRVGARNDNKAPRGEMRANAAFTLAEVLITIGIVGIVAAMTIPNLIQSQYEKSTVAKLRKVNYNLQHSFQMIKRDDISLFAQPDVSELTRLLASHLKTSKVCYPPKATECMDNAAYKEVGGGVASGIISSSMGAIVLLDGTTITTTYFYANGSYTAQLFVDINGSKKLPNRLGEDTFSFYITQNNYDETLAPRGNANWKNDGYCHPKFKWNNSHNGLGCTKWVVQQGNMNYLH